MILSQQWKKFSVDNPYSDICAEFAQTHQSAGTQIYNEVADLIECRASKDRQYKVHSSEPSWRKSKNIWQDSTRISGLRN